MLRDAEHREDDWFKKVVFDVCICGAGPAGITLARTLGRKGYKVALLEAGGLQRTQESQELYEGESVGLQYFPTEKARLRFLGGTSNHWAGFSRPLDQRDFAPLRHHPFNGWPIAQSDLKPYTKETEATLELQQVPAIPLKVIGSGNASRRVNSYRISPTRFGETYRSELAGSDKIYLYINANLVDMRMEDNYREVADMQFRSYARSEPFVVRAKHYVLCLGGMENPRALLNADKQLRRGVGNDNDLVGRYFCEHLGCELGKILMERPYLASQLYWAADRVIAEQECLPFQLLVSPVDQSKSAVRRGIDATLCLTTFTERLGAYVFSKAPVCFDAKVQIYCQQANNPDSRVSLSHQKDRFGQRRLRLDWRLSELDYHTMRVAALEYASYVAESGEGRMQLVPWLRPSVEEVAATRGISGAYHHMCTTRMSDDPKTGVVDRNCRVHGIENLFIGGSSVFSSAGLSNPTYTIVQLALRLGDHLDTQLR